MTLVKDAERRRPRRWVLYLAAGLALCVAGPAAAGAGWVATKTVEADRGQPTPDAAANVFMLAVSSGEELGLRAALAPSRRDELVDEWRRIRGDITRTSPQPSKVSAGVFVVDDQGDDRAQVVTEVQAVWWGTVSMAGTPHAWRFETRRDGGGWRVWSVDPHPWCGGHVRAEACR
ncbi:MULTISPECIES: hypothetical protein [unclassified Micromonospora]|uniref:hypothetical protein n=1 Tax=unclassified Micromonospora TaxID=2617518 RepID=UPI00098CF219|nr:MULTISPECIES: hypothetical protein [unclassified Micromonospora]MDI5937933.1 hypothetical protein [Micromonospora sp. DH15]OON27058.1 hypothetical protein BSA16_34035 [Micromonospora sp. Rc5]